MSASAPWTSDVSRRAVQRLREIVARGGLPAYLATDRTTGELVNPEARSLFTALPSVSPATAPDELVEHGLIARLPKNLGLAYEKPKYFKGRRVFVQTHASHRVRDKHHPVGEYRADAPLGFTHRGVLFGRRGDRLLVELEGAPELLAFHETDLFAWNEPCGVAPGGGNLSGVAVDYNEPIFKGHVCAAYVELAPLIEALDFDAPDATLAPAHEDLVARLARRVHMSFAGRGEGYTGTRAGSLLSGGQGVSFVQRAVAAAFLQAFSRPLALEVQAAVGRTLRLGAPHGFTIVTLRPTMRRFVCDPAWSEPFTALDVAFFGPSWGHDRRLVAFEGQRVLTVRPEEVVLPEVLGS